ncbi:MAG TPA: hypothetical protein PKE55_14845, partial [Kiritimatiellia bacterium]|nr:hypothetical protein [Kiritimatiellia bacterium]
ESIFGLCVHPFVDSPATGYLFRIMVYLDKACDKAPDKVRKIHAEKPEEPGKQPSSRFQTLENRHPLCPSAKD